MNYEEKIDERERWAHGGVPFEAPFMGQRRRRSLARIWLSLIYLAIETIFNDTTKQERRFSSLNRNRFQIKI